MSYTVFIPENVEKELQGMDKTKQEDFASQIDKLESYPKKYGKPLKGRLHGYWQLRFADKYRTWYTVDEGEQKVTVEAVKHKDDAVKDY